jgi:hypothetical protein
MRHLIHRVVACMQESPASTQSLQLCTGRQSSTLPVHRLCSTCRQSNTRATVSTHRLPMLHVVDHVLGAILMQRVRVLDAWHACNRNIVNIISIAAYNRATGQCLDLHSIRFCSSVWRNACVVRDTIALTAFALPATFAAVTSTW